MKSFVFLIILKSIEFSLSRIQSTESCFWFLFLFSISQVDFEDALSPSWENLMRGQVS